MIGIVSVRIVDAINVINGGSKLFYNVRPALRRQGLGFQMLNIRTMPNSSTGVEFITTALLLQNWLLCVRAYLLTILNND
jgi:hypothetical protein